MYMYSLKYSLFSFFLFLCLAMIQLYLVVIYDNKYDDDSSCFSYSLTILLHLFSILWS